MSRIEEALRRLNGADLPARSERNPNAEPFRSPWDFQKSRAIGEGDFQKSRANGHEAITTSPGPEPVGKGGAISGFNSQWRERLVVSPDVDPILVEQFRRLAATLHHAQATNNVRTVMVTSATPGDGKTQTAINLALILSESYGRKVLLVDADLRRPAIRDVSHIPDVVGLADGLRAKADQKLTVFQLTSRLSLLPAGRPDPDPMSGLTSSRMGQILSDAAKRYDWVVVDAPPVGTVADASILSEMVDATLLVVRARQTSCALTQKAIDAIGRERILGVVLNAVDKIDDAGYSHYYHQPSDERALVAK
jgi:protein-tyrosine kinase